MLDDMFKNAPPINQPIKDITSAKFVFPRLTQVARRVYFAPIGFLNFGITAHS